MDVYKAKPGSTENSIISRQPLKLLKNVKYGTYQLYAVVSNENTNFLNESLKIAILETMSWLRKRFRDFDIPEQINFPEPDNYLSVNHEDFKSFRIENGYTVEVIYFLKS